MPEVRPDHLLVKVMAASTALTFFNAKASTVLRLTATELEALMPWNFKPDAIG
jgi:hypothetical protein